jgi:hypothetical protein
MSVKLKLLENTDTTNNVLKRQVQMLESQYAKQVEDYQFLNIQFEQIKADFADRDPDYAAELDALRDIQREILQTKRDMMNSRLDGLANTSSDNVTGNSGSLPAATNTQANIDPHMILRRKLPQRKTGGVTGTQKEKLHDQIETILKQMESLQAEYKLAQTTWNEIKSTMESNFDKERSELLQQITTNQTTLDRLEQICSFNMGKAKKEYRNGKHAYAFIHIILDKIEKLQNEREDLERIRIANEKRLRQHYDRQVDDLLKDLDFSRQQLANITESFRTAQAELMKQRNELYVSKQQQSNERQVRQRMEQQIKEMKVLIAHGYRQVQQ